MLSINTKVASSFEAYIMVNDLSFKRFSKKAYIFQLLGQEKKLHIEQTVKTNKPKPNH